jgi:serine/threonine protein kinase
VNYVVNAIPGYSIGQQVGTGAKSSIYLATELGTGKGYALKRVVKHEPRDQRYFEQVYIEFKVSSQTNHPALRRSYRLRKVRRWFRIREVLLLMEYVRGQTLEQSRPQGISEAVEIFLKAAKGLEALHQMGFVHADIKPNNIIVGPDGEVKIIDFGQSCPMGFVKPRIQGTPDYIAPEQVRRLPLDQRTDVFNFGATLYWVLTNRPFPTLLPSRRPNGIELAHERAAITPHEADPNVPAPLSRLVMDCCQSNPQERPGDIRQVIARLVVVQHVLKDRAKEPQNGDDADGCGDRAESAGPPSRSS